MQRRNHIPLSEKGRGVVFETDSPAPTFVHEAHARLHWPWLGKPDGGDSSGGAPAGLDYVDARHDLALVRRRACRR
jgi:hypothetical protein